MVSKIQSALKGMFGRTDSHIERLSGVTVMTEQAARLFEVFARESNYASERSFARRDPAAMEDLFEARLRSVESIQADIVSMERRADQMQKDAVFAVSHALLLPFDRSHMFRLLNRADDIIDNIRKVSARFVLYQMPFSADMGTMAARIAEAASILNGATPLLVNVPKNAAALTEAASRVRQLERDVDGMHMDILESLLVPAGPLLEPLVESESIPTKMATRIAGRYIPAEFTPMRECVDRIERVMDSCKAYAEAIEIVVTDNA